MKYFTVLCLIAMYLAAVCYAAEAEIDSSVAAEKKTEKRGIYGFGYGGHGGYYGGSGFGGGYGGHYGGYGGYPSYGGHYIQSPAYYGGGHYGGGHLGGGYYPHHGYYGFH